MKPPYLITPIILKLVSSISEKIGAVNATHLDKPAAELRKKNQIKTIQSTLEIEGNTLSAKQITALIENKRVLAPEKEIIEVKNAIEVYKNINQFNYSSITDFCDTHHLLMNNLVDNSGVFRKTEVGIIKGSNVQHLAPPAHMVNSSMKKLFSYLIDSDELLLIKSCVFHYEVEFIHPFIDGNGRMGRLWQTLILMSHNRLFEFLPIETMIKQTQEAYYHALSLSDKSGQSTTFIEYMLNVIDKSLALLLSTQTPSLSSTDRINHFKETVGSNNFSRKNYMRSFKEISSATASRDLKRAVDEGIILKIGEKRLTKYTYN